MIFIVKVKVCGLSRLCDIECVNKQMPDYIGFVFAKSRRQVTQRQALELRSRLTSSIIPVGVFVDEATENILSLLQNGVIDIAQLHGSEDEAYIQKLKSMTNKPIIKAVTVQKKGDAQNWNHSSADYLLLDHNGGGTGKSFDWNLIGDISKPYFLAGGLHQDNVTEAIQKTVSFAVDVSSGVETYGLKDPFKIKEFIRRVRNAR